MEERFTVQLDASAQPEKVAKLAERLADAFLLSQEEAQALLSADTLVLKRSEALTLVRMCRQEGVAVSLNAPLLTPAVRTYRWLKRFTLPIVFSFSSALALLVLVLWMIPNSPPESVSADATVDRGGVAVALPWVESVDAKDTSDVIVVEPYGTIADSSSAQTETSLSSEGDGEERVAVESSVQNEGSFGADLFSAARDLSARDLNAVLDRSPKIDLRDSYGQTPLMYAAENSSAENIVVLLGAGANVNAQTDAGWTPLMYAARNPLGSESTETLLEAGADPSAKNASGHNG